MNFLSRALSIGVLAAILAHGVEGQCVPQVPALTAFSPFPGDPGQFGGAVAASERFAVVGAAREGPGNLELGAAYIYRFSAPGWGPGRRLESPSDQRGEAFGYSVAVVGDEILIGAPWRRVGNAWVGGVYVFRRDPRADAWRALEVLVPTGWSHLYGSRLAHDGERLLVGTSSTVYVNERDPDTGRWGVTRGLFPSGFVSQYGRAFDIDADTIVVGAPKADTAFVYERDPISSVWTEAALLVPAQAGGDFGYDVAVSGDMILVGAPKHEQITVFTRDPSGAWIETQSIAPPGAVFLFGQTVACDGELAVAGGATGMAKGAVWVFGRDPSTGQLVKAGRIEDASTGIFSGFGLNLDVVGPRVVVGDAGSGRAHVYDEVTTLAPTLYCTSGSFAIGCTPRLSFEGAPSASQGAGFRLRVDKLEGGSTGWFVFGSNGRQAVPWDGSGLLCVKPPTLATSPKTNAAAAGKCFGSHEVDLNAHWAARPETNPGAGVTAQTQYLARGPLGDWVASEALQFLVCP